MIKSAVLAASLSSAAFLAACETTEQSAAAGGLTGAAIGATIADDDLKGAVIGGAIGAAAGTLVSEANQPGDCIYRDSYGREYVADCPN
ncbi:glycine zipper 2TM domain-containing protein [Rhodobacteraceae bacterium 2CG4]|uniref:Glycine zipper 2TM domain-containing protein n=1 Tax=Halovulum marinum TaxID=2662447 RepID=A0A6L5Z5U3_9RHOB|nr:YMGG-like glycine zipper-containing protein [Halovulum marinum]MSU91450.1 glycine zipper 2TM domain-containing protein [Halovulum marinum]